MIPVFGCETARELIDAFVDGELTMPQQVAMQRHISSCRTCSAHLEDMSLISWSIKTGTPRVHAVDDNAAALVILQSDVLARIRAERALSLRSRLSEMFSDMRLVWPALGASVAVLLCLLGASSIWQLTTQWHPLSVPAMLEREANRGSEDNPLRLEDAAWGPVILNGGLALDGLVTVFEGGQLYEAVITRGGKVIDARFLNSSPDVQPAGQTNGVDVVRAMEQWQATPAQSRGRRPMAVRALIYFTTMTVTADGSFARSRRPGRSKDAIVPSGFRSSAVDQGSAAA